MPKYFICPSCIGRKSEGIELLTPCTRWLEEGHDHPDPCPKRARGVEIEDEPSWREVSDAAFKVFTELGQIINARTRIFYEKD